jgi:hypothetical protein
VKTLASVPWILERGPRPTPRSVPKNPRHHDLRPLGPRGDAGLLGTALRSGRDGVHRAIRGRGAGRSLKAVVPGLLHASFDG